MLKPHLAVIVSLLAACEPPAALEDGGSTRSDGGPRNDGRADAENARPDAYRARPDAQVHIADCGALPAPGTWEQITPPGITDEPERGAFAFAVDPLNSGTIYLGTRYEGLWKTTNCGADWTRLDMGTGTEALDRAMHWTFVIDPYDSNIVYTNAGYGNGSNGLFRSTNSGADWTQIYPPADLGSLAPPIPDFANTLSMDPSDNLHLLLTFHQRCAPPHGGICLAESFDGGDTWELVDGDPRWGSSGEGIKAFILDDAQSWVWASQADGLWITHDGGASWSQISTQSANHLQSPSVYRSLDGTFYLSGMGDLWRSPTGTSRGAWLAVPETGPFPGGVVSDGTTMYMSNCYYPRFCVEARPYYFTSPESDGVTWTPMAEPPIEITTQGGVLDYDRGHHILYSANLDGGFWRLVTE